ncbi:MAG: DoxX family protein [Armatimonadetes bacterium]|nr:DoxX family protein [Anaerolineae bacterium]
MNPLKITFNRIDITLTNWMAHNGITVLRISLGIIFLWFGALKFFPNLSAAEEIATRTISTLTFGIVTPAVSLPVLAAWEVLIGLGLLSGRFTRITLALLWLQMLGTVTPLVLFPTETWTVFPIAPTLEGQYIIKNLVLVSAGLVIGATARGGRLVAEPLVLEKARVGLS